MRTNTVFSKLIIILLILGLLLLPGCSSSVANQPATTPPATTPPATTVPATTAPPRNTVDIVVQDASFTYTLTEADVTEFYTLLTQCEDLSINSTDAAAVDALSDKLDEKFAMLEEQLSIAMILYYGNLKDETASQLYLDCTDTVTQANNDYLMMARRVYLSDSPHKDLLFADWTEEDFKFLMAYTEEVMQLQQRNSELEVAYQSLQNDPEMYDKMVPLYIETVQNNNRIAQIYGYSNYYEYAYDLVYERDYTHDKIEAMRTYTKQYLVPALNGANSKFQGSLRRLSANAQETLISFLYNSYTTNKKTYLNYYLADLPEQTQNDMLEMFNGNIVMKESVSGAQEGAFTTSIGDDQLICYFGPGYSNAMTIVHELGHYYGGQYTDLQDIPLDLAETQSQGNEMLFLAYLQQDMSEKIYTTLVNYRTYSDLAQILICVLVDEFEERVYTHENIASLTGDDLDAIMEEICEPYGGIDRISASVTDIQTYWRMVVIEQPVYYISYAVSSLAAMNLFTAANEDYDAAVETYRTLIEQIDPEKGFLGNIQAAGIKDPFDEEVYKALYEKYA